MIVFQSWDVLGEGGLSRREPFLTLLYRSDRHKMHDELVTPRGPPQITAAVVPTHNVKSETEPLLQQEGRYYQSVPEVAIHFSSAPPEPCSELGSQNWRPTEKKEQEKVEGANWFGILLAFLSGAFFTLSSAGVKGLKSIDPMELLVLRSLLQIVAMLSIAVRNGQNLLGPKGQRGLLQLQGIVGGSTLVLLFFTFRRLPLGDATTIIFSSPVFVMIMSFLFLREPCGFFRTMIVSLLLTGVVLISKPPFIFKEGKNSRLSLQVLQQAAGDKENLVGGSRQPITNVKVGVKLGEKCEKNNAINEKVIEHTLMKGNLKKKKVADKFVQTDKVEDKPKITITDLTSEEPPSENYWQLLAEQRRIALEECLEENRTLHERLQLLEEEKEVAEQMLAESRSLVEVLKEIIGENDEAQNDCEGE